MHFAFPDVLTEIVAIVVIAAVFAFTAARLRQPVILAFIAAGVVVGPSGLGWVRSADEIHLLAEIGLAMLLSVVGLKLDLNLMRSVGSTVVIIGVIQVGLTALIGFGISRLLGVGSGSALYIALAVAFSSTVIAVKLLSDKKDLDSLYGRIALGILIVQDVLVVFALTILPAFGGGELLYTALAFSLVVVKGAALMAGVGLLGLLVLPRVIEKLSKSGELLLLFAISWALAVATLAGMLGLSREVGAFLAGVALATTQHRDIVGAKLVGLRDFLLLFFFLDLGARLNLGALGAGAAMTVPLSIFVLIGKPLIILAVMSMLGYRKRTGFLTGFTLSQTSEFSLILASVGVKSGHIGQQTLGLITLTTAVTIGFSALMVSNLQPMYDRLRTLLRRADTGKGYREQAEDIATPSDVEIIVIGLGRYGKIIALELIDRGRAVLGVDFDTLAVSECNRLGIPAVFGDAEDPEYLSYLPLSSAKWVVCSIRDTGLTRVLTAGLRQHGYHGVLALTADDDEMAAELQRSGADMVFVPFEDSAVKAVDLIHATEREINRKMMDQQIAAVTDHYIVCGYGRMGQQIVKDFQRDNVPVVVVEANPEQLPKLERSGVLHVVGEASEDAVLLSAGIERAKGLIAVCPTDEDNVFIVLTARVLNPGLFIVARSILEENQDKLRRAGADRVVSPYILGGRHMAAAVTKPEIMEFVDLVLQANHFDVGIAHAVVSEDSPQAGHTLAEAGLCQERCATVIAVRRAGELRTNPDSDYLIQAGDEMVILGTHAQLDATRVVLGGRQQE